MKLRALRFQALQSDINFGHLLIYGEMTSELLKKFHSLVRLLAQL